MSSSETFAELRFAQQLGSTELDIRNKAVKKLKNFLIFKSSEEGFSYEDFIKIWKGLYYCMYMSDKPLVQEELAEEISNLIHCVSTNPQKLLFFKASIDTFSREWSGIDKYRYDKFLMLVTRILRQTLVFMSKISWSKIVLKEFCDILESNIVCPSDDKNEKPQELKMHISDVILEELAKVGKEKLPDRVLIAVIQPFLKVLAMSSNQTYVLNVTNRILHDLLKQSKLGLENEDDISSREVFVLPRKAKKKLKDEEMESDEEIENNKYDDIVMDPRIGGVDVHLPLLRPNYNKVAAAIETLAHNPKVSKGRRNSLFAHARKFRLLSEGVYPFNLPEVAEQLEHKVLAKNALKRLAEFDDEISSKRKKVIDEDDINEIENYESEKAISKRKEKIMKEMTAKKEANLKRSKLVKNRKARRLRKINKYSKNPKTLQKFLQKEREEKKKKRQQQKLKEASIDVKPKEPETNNDAVKSKAEVKISVEKNNSPGNVKSKNELKKNVNKLNISNDEKLIDNSEEKMGMVNGLKTKKAGKNIIKKANVQNKEKSKSSPKSLEKNLDNNNPWKTPLKEGEIEFTVTKKKYSKKVNTGMLMRKTPNVNTNGKTLKINLKKNTEHEFGDYKAVLKQSPGIPFSAQKKPLQSVLKSSPSPNLIKKSKKVKSRINFLRRKSKL